MVNHERVLNQSVLLIHHGKMGLINDISMITEAVKTIAEAKFTQILDKSTLVQLQTDLIYLLDKIKGNDRITTLFQNRAMFVIKTIENSNHSSLSQFKFYHGIPIQTGMNTISPRVKNFDMKKFVDAYCDFVFSYWDGMCNETLALIRPCSSLASTTHELSTISLREANEVKCNHILIACSKEKKWCRAYTEEGKVVYEKTEFDSLPLLLKHFMKKIRFVGCPPQKSIDLFFDRYEKNLCNIKTVDPILNEMNDPISQVPLEKACITHEGRTYSRDTILSWIKINPIDPETRSPILKELLRPNRLADRIIATRRDMLRLKCTDMDGILNLLKDPLNPEAIMEDPVIASDDVTYERKSLLIYLEQKGNVLPNGKACTPEELIPNRIVKQIIELCTIPK